MFRFGVLVLLCISLVAGSAAARPNILFIYTDDQAVWSMSSVNPEAHTPHLDGLFARGATFTNSFVTTPVCSPSRVGLLASRYGTEMGITDWINPREEPALGLAPRTASWPRELQAAGYETALVGKWHLGTEDGFHPSVFGYEHFTGFRDGGRPPENPELEIDGADRIFEGLTTDILAEEAIGFLEHRDAGRPFLLSLHFRAPHARWLPVAEADFAPYESLNPTLPDPDFPDLDVERVKRSTREYLASVTGVDRNVGRVLAALERLGLREDTVIVFTSDHGYNIGHHGLIHKGNGRWITVAARGKGGKDPGVTRPNMWDTSLRVPTAVVWPGVVDPGATIANTVTNLDWFPTLLEIAGVALPERAILRGRSVAPLLTGEPVQWEERFYGEYSIHHYETAHLRMWRTPQWKLVRDYLNPGRDELYDLRADPDESVNLIESGEHGEILHSLDGELSYFMERAGIPRGGD